MVRKAPCPTLTVRADADVAPDQAVRRVLAPVDFSDASRSAVRHAKEIALTYGAEIDLLHVVEEPFYPPAYGLGETGFPTDKVIGSVEDELADLARSEVGYEHVMIEARTGEPSREILNYIDENEVDLTVIASHGRTGLDRMLIGSVAERVVRQSPTPVFVAKPDRAALVSSDAAEAASARD
ncbi:universal stress protein [Salinibacter ruber]|uniref:universal stress protein n=1 Tax=Salinibacter ruber TaxID=146919 RepID=UPI00216A3135